MKQNLMLRKIRRQILDIEADINYKRSTGSVCRYYKFWWYTAIMRADRAAILLLTNPKPYDLKEMSLPRFEALSEIVSQKNTELLGKVSHFLKDGLEVLSNPTYLNWGIYNFNLAKIWPFLAAQKEPEINMTMFLKKSEDGLLTDYAILRVEPVNKNWIILLASLDSRGKQPDSKLVSVEIIS